MITSSLIMVLNKIFAGILVILIFITVYEISNNTELELNQRFKQGEVAFMNLLSLKVFESEPPVDTRPLFVLIISSNPRSGSTMFSELLATQNNSVLFFEPLWNQMTKPCFQDGSCVSEFIENIFNCTYEQDFEDWLRDKLIFFRYFHPSARGCISEKCRHQFDMRGLCQNSTVRFAKVIRARLSWLKGLLENPDTNVKIIHLTRDPRGSINSIYNIGWDATPKLKCGALDEDMEEYDILRSIYPDRIKSVQLEILSLDQINVMKEIQHFLYGTPEIPRETENYIQKHMNADVLSINNMDTRKNSSAEYQAWRRKISSSLLQKIESEPLCIKVLEKMGHTIFGTIENTLNFSISLWN